MRRIYVLNIEEPNIDYINCSDIEFMKECEEHGRIYEDLEGFVKDFNFENILTTIGQIRIIDPSPKLYYTITKHTDSSDSLNGIRTITVYRMGVNDLKLLAELEAKSDELGEYFYTDEEEIENYIWDNEIFPEDTNFEMIQL